MELDIRYEKKCTLVANFFDYFTVKNTTECANILESVKFYLDVECSITKDKYLKLKGTYDPMIIKNLFSKLPNYHRG